jgi:hypothetical protein
MLTTLFTARLIDLAAFLSVKREVSNRIVLRGAFKSC